MRHLLLLSVLLIGPTLRLSAQFQVSGTVMIEGPVSGIEVSVKGTNIKTVTDSLGNFKINATNDTASLLFTHDTYLPLTVPINHQSTLQVSMAYDDVAFNKKENEYITVDFKINKILVWVLCLLIIGFVIYKIVRR
jgi:hypothetical protein